MAFIQDNTDSYEEIKIPVPWGHIAGKWWGPKDVQPILAIHGFQDNAGSFDPLAMSLKKRNHSILCIDLPGHGFSSNYQKGVFYNLVWDGVYIIHRIVKHFAWNSKITIIAHSMGGAMALHYASIFSGSVQKFIGLDCIGSAPDNISEVLQNFGTCIDKFLDLEETNNETLSYEYEDIRDMIMETRENAFTSAALNIIMKRSVKPSDIEEDCYVYCRDPRLNYSQNTLMAKSDFLSLSSNVKCDILIIRAENGITFNDCTDELLEIFKQNGCYLDVHTVFGNHYVHLNNHLAILDHVLNFLKH